VPDRLDSGKLRWKGARDVPLFLDIPSAIFIGVLIVVALAVVRGLWGILRGNTELDTSASWGRQIFGRWKKS
jgi:hypothetical protein